MVALCAATAATAALAGCDSTGDSSAPLVVPAATTSADPAASAAPGEDDPFSSMTADGLMSLARANMRASGAMTVTLNSTEEGRTVQIKAALSAAGKCAAAIRIGGQDMQVVVTGPTHVYMKADPGFWRSAGGSQGGRLAAAVGDHWVKLTDKVLEHGNIREFCSFDSFLETVLSDEDSGSEVVKGAPTTLDGRQVIPLVEELTDETDTMYVSTGKTPYIVKIEGEGGDSPGSGSFSDFGKPPHISAPPASQTLDMADLGVQPGNGISI